VGCLCQCSGVWSNARNHRAPDPPSRQPR
jgi:hypothetical protein